MATNIQQLVVGFHYDMPLIRWKPLDGRQIEK
jgi:hypothetical protein